MKNKVLREKSNCVVCRSSKSTKAQQQQINKPILKKKYKNMHIYCKNCKKHTGNTFPKTLALISKNKIKEETKCVICLTERTFIYKTEEKYGLESELEIFFSFLPADVINKHEDLLREM